MLSLFGRLFALLNFEVNIDNLGRQSDVSVRLLVHWLLRISFFWLLENSAILSFSLIALGHHLHVQMVAVVDIFIEIRHHPWVLVIYAILSIEFLFFLINCFLFFLCLPKNLGRIEIVGICSRCILLFLAYRHIFLWVTRFLFLLLLFLSFFLHFLS